MADPMQYQTILEAAEAAAKALLSGDGWNVRILKKPKYDPAWIDLPACVIAPRGDLVESVKKLNFKNDHTQLGYDVYVGLFVDARSNDPGQLFKRTNARQTVRERAWDPDLVGDAAGDFDVDYDPFGIGGEAPPEGVDGSWQKFTVTVKVRRQNP